MDRAFDAMGMALHLNKGSSTVKSSPYTRESTFAVIMPASFMAERAVILMPFVWSGLDADMFYTIGIRVKAAIFNNRVLDI
ncbi:hypothetical protein HDR58_09530 [bacterium]|nr:hypothetical protein [bacterium]